VRKLLIALALTAGGLVGTVAPAQARAVSLRVPISGVVPNPCGQPVTVSGTIHVVGHTTEDQAGGVHFASHINAQRVQGVDASGNRYVVHNVINDRYSLNAAKGAATTDTFTRAAHIIRRGEDAEDDDFLLHMTLHVTINADGEVTAEVVETRIECK
jgi:hypothetical protein